MSRKRKPREPLDDFWDAIARATIAAREINAGNPEPSDDADKDNPRDDCPICRGGSGEACSEHFL